QCQLAIAHTLQHVAQTSRAGNGRRLELVTGGDHLGFSFLGDEERFVFVMLFHAVSLATFLGQNGMLSSHALAVLIAAALALILTSSDLMNLIEAATWLKINRLSS